MHRKPDVRSAALHPGLHHGQPSMLAVNHGDEVLVRHSVMGLPRWDAEGESLQENEKDDATDEAADDHGGER